MTGFDLPPIFTEDPESLVRRARTVRTEVDLAFFVPSTSTPMPNQEKTLHDYSAPSADQVPPAPRSTPGMKTSRSRLASLRWYRLAYSVASLMKTRAPTCNHSWSCAVPSLYGECRKMPFIYSYSHSHFWERRSSGSMQTVQILTPG
jgi:hypothetical protein